MSYHISGVLCPSCELVRLATLREKNAISRLLRSFMRIRILMDATKKEMGTRQKYAVSVDRVCEEYRTFDIFYILAYCPRVILFLQSFTFTFLTIAGKFALNDKSGFPFLLKFPCRFVFAAEQNKRSYVFQSRAQIHRSLESHRKSVSFVCIEMLEYRHIKLYQDVRLQS